MAITGAEVGFVSADRKLVDFIAQVFELEELPRSKSTTNSCTSCRLRNRPPVSAAGS
jgi:hypothetical protein